MADECTHALAMDAHASTSPYGHLHSQAKKVIFNVNRYFLEEKANGAPMLPPSQALTRTAMATKTSERERERARKAGGRSVVSVKTRQHWGISLNNSASPAKIRCVEYSEDITVLWLVFPA